MPDNFSKFNYRFSFRPGPQHYSHPHLKHFRPPSKYCLDPGLKQILLLVNTNLLGKDNVLIHFMN